MKRRLCFKDECNQMIFDMLSCIIKGLLKIKVLLANNLIYRVLRLDGVLLIGFSKTFSMAFLAKFFVLVIQKMVFFDFREGLVRIKNKP